MGTLTNSEDQDDMLHNLTFHQCLHCSLRLKRSSKKELQINLKIITCDPLIYTLNHPMLFVSYQVVEPFRIQMVKTFLSIANNGETNCLRGF